MPFPANDRKIKQSKAVIPTVFLALALAVSGCASSKQGNIGTHASPGAQSNVKPGSADARLAVSTWGARYEKNRQDKNTILGFADALRQNGQITQAMAVLRSAVVVHTNDRDIASAYGKILAMNGKFDEALNVIRRVQVPQTPDWKLLSAEAAVLDQTGNHARARSLYTQALQIKPDEPTLLNNLGLSHLLSNQLPEAEYNLRRAANLPGADSRVRQNLALVLGLQGKFQEAESVALTELDQQQAQANMAYLKHMLNQRS